CLQVYSTPFTF
nr:immunoglobulin light chain junction region [Macaca mulatta]MOX27691.1 immunoglobulin light chain junction region [Macaca mulatta]